MSRIMLTGQADLTTAVDAVNRGSIFRFLTKPCEPELFRSVIEAGLKQFRLIRAERAILEQTVQGAVGMLADVLALAQPAAFGRARRIHHYVSHVVAALRVEDAWQIQTAALLSQVGCVAVPNDILERVSRGEHLPSEQSAMLERHPRLAADLVQRIPRLQGVAEIIAAQVRGTDRGKTKNPDLRLGAAILAAATEFEELISMGARPAQALEAMRKESRHPERILEALATASLEGRPTWVMVVSLAQLRPGMVLEEEVRSESGLLLVSKGHVVTVGSLQRLRNYAEFGSLRNRVYKVLQSKREQDGDVTAA
jgi:response regulator RpfG family c-di-GMP phosphodiesterase